MQFYNPSKIITDVLSKYLEFDPEELKLGIWNGKLSIQNVELKRDAMYPLLNGAAVANQDLKPPLNLKLVKGTVGQMRVRIPWKRLVWGQGDVKLEISDVTIAVAYESREETAARNLPKEQETTAEVEEDAEESEEEIKRKRDLKQEWLREAERCQLQGRPLPTKTDIAENAAEETNNMDGQTSGAVRRGRVDTWLKNTTESFAWRFLAGLQASIRNVRVVIVQDGVEIGTIFHAMDIIPKSLNAMANPAEGDQQDTELSGDTPADASMATPPPDVVPQGEYDDGEHLDKIVKLQSFGIFVRWEDKKNKSPKTLRFSTSVAADDYVLRPTEGNLAISIFDPYPPGKQTKKKVPTIEEEPTTPTTATATATVDSASSSKSRRSKRDKRPLVTDGKPLETPAGSDAVEAEGSPKQLRPALKRPDRVSSSTRQFSMAETPTSGNRLKSHTVDISGAADSSGHARGKSTVSRANLSRVTSAGHKRKISTLSGRSIPLLPTDDTSTIQTPGDLDGNGAKPPSLDLDLSFGDVTTMFSSRHYHLILTFQSTVERMKNGRPDKSISSCFTELAPDKKRSVYVDAPFSAVKNVNDAAKRSVYVDAPTSAVKKVNDAAITSQLPPSALKSSRPDNLHRAKTTGGVDFSSAPPERVQLHLQLQLQPPSMRDENRRVVRDWWQYAYTAALYEIRQRRKEESTFDGKNLKFDWEKQSYKRKEYVALYIATRLEPSSVLRSVELKVKLGTKSPEEELLKIEDELPVEQILLYRSIARSARVRGMRKMPSSVLKLRSNKWLTGKDSSTLSPPMSPGVESLPSTLSVVEVAPVEDLAEVEADCTDINGLRREADALRMRTMKKGDSRQRTTNLKRLLREDIDGSLASRMGRATNGSRNIADHVSSGSKGLTKEGNGSIQRDDNLDGRTVRSFKTARTSRTAGTTAGATEKDVSSSGKLRISASISFSNVEVMVYQENSYTGEAADSMQFRPVLTGQSSGVLDFRMRTSAGLQVITNDASSSFMSDVSILSDDQKFFDQNDDTLSMSDAESVGDAPIMSSTDFLMFGLPQNIILRATASGLEGKTRGQSGGQQILSLSVDGMDVDGDKNSALLSLKPMSTGISDPIDEVHIGKKTKKPGKKRTAVSFAELEMFQQQAVLLSILSKETGSHVQCDLCKTVVTCNLQATMKIYEFFTNVEVAFPQPLIAPSKAEDLRRSVFQRLASVKQAGENTNESGFSRAFRLHGLEVGIRGPDDDGKDAETSGAEAKLLLDLIEYYDGELFEDILMLSNDSVEADSRKSYEASVLASDREWQRRNLNMLDMTRLVEGHRPAPPSSSRHAVISVTGIDFSVSTGTAVEDPTCYKLLDAPIDFEMLVTKNYSIDFLSPVPSKQISAEISPVQIILSEARVGLLSSAALSFRGLKDIDAESAPESSTTVEPLPRLAALSIQILVALELRISSMRLACVDDSAELRPSESIREIIMEESLSDFVSVLSCFNLDYPTKESVEVAGNICVDRLRVLGLSEDEAHDCVHAARLNFLAGMDAMKRSQSELLRELASQEVRGAVASAGEDEGPYHTSAGDSVPSVTEISSDDSEESVDIIDTTLKGAVEKTMFSFSSLLKTSSPVSRALSEFLVIDLPTGATLSVTKMFYDFRLECHLKSLNVRNASGSHLLSFHRPYMQRLKVDKDVHSSTAPGGSWEEGDDSSAISFSFFILDSDYNFGEGGLPLAVLGSHDMLNKTVTPRQQQQLTHVVVGQIDILFSCAIVDQAIQSVSSLVAPVKSDGEMNDRDAKEIQSNFFVAASSFNMIFTSDELVPFCRVEAEECTVDNAVDSSKASAERTCINMAAASLRVLDLTPEGYGYPDILYPLAMKDMSSSAPCSSFVLHYFPSSDNWKEPSKVDMELREMRVVMLLRFLNELMQYMASKDHGAGMLLDKFGFWDATFDAKGNPPPPFQYHITLIDSSIILPRSSTNIDCLALEVDKIAIFNGSAPSSFKMPNATSALMVPRNVVYKRVNDRILSTHVSSTSASSEAEFFDCVDSHDSLDDHDSLTISSFKKGWVKRTTVLLEKFRLLTSLPSGSLSGRPPEDPLIHKFYCLKGRAVDKMPVYTRLQSFDNSVPTKTGVTGKPSRFWSEITASVCSLEIIADKVPNLRLLVSDRPIQRDTNVEIHSLKLDMRLSDLCLVLSVWYSNMQELPVMFPYAPTTVEATATATQPSAKVPEYGTDEYVMRLKNPTGVKSEIALVVDALTIRGSFDQSGYFAEDPRSLRLYAPGKGETENTPQIGLLPFKVGLIDFVLDMSTDKDGITRLACGSSGFEVFDERRAKGFEEVFRVGNQINETGRDYTSGEDNISQSDQHVPNVERRAWADSSWGLDCCGQTLRGVLPQPFQATVFMTPGWSLTNLGLENADVVVTDFSPVGILADYFASYFSSAAYGNPVFEAAKRKEELKSELRGPEMKVETNSKQVSTNTDFRLWLLHPCVCVPDSLVHSAAPSLSIDSQTGVCYHYRSIETCSVQEVGTTDLSLRFWEEFRKPSICRKTSMERDARALVEGLSFALRMNVNSENNHTDYVFRIPMLDPRIHDEKAIFSVAAPEYDVKPIVLPPPRICIPFVEPSREMGSIVSEVTIFIEVFPTVSSILQKLTYVPEDVQLMDKSGPEPAGEDGSHVVEIAEVRPFAALVHIDSFRIFAIDPVLEKHLPIALLCVSPLEANVSKLGGNGGSEQVRNGDAYPSDLQVTLKVHVWADYFKLGTTRSWEPFLEPCRCLILYEKSKRRGQGLSLYSDDAIHTNITGSLLLTLDENIRSFSRAISETFGDSKTKMRSYEPSQHSVSPKDGSGAYISDQLLTDDGPPLFIRHEVPKPIPKDGRTAFSFRNLTGQKIRIHQLVGKGSSAESESVVAYLDHNETTTLSFDATISVIRNLGIVEVPFPGLPNSRRGDQGMSLVDHEVDIQIPGFRWLAGVSVNTSGRKFDTIVPVSPIVLEKAQRDWRLRNAMKIMTEVGVENGGRLIAARSIFDVRNMTSHAIYLNLNPDPTQRPLVRSFVSAGADSGQRLVDPGASFQVSSLLVEASLELEGHHLGSFWIRPDDSEDNKDIAYIFSQRDDNSVSVVEFSSRPIQLAKLVHESALIFKSNGGEDLEPEKVTSGVQLSCPVIASSAGVPIAPFCYVVEVRRSPLVKSLDCPVSDLSPVTTPKQEKSTPQPLKGGKGVERGMVTNFRARENRSHLAHGPVSYSLLIHPPLVIENLLPKRGRFELMHATRRTVLWFGDLNPGDRIPIHTVGLDAPLLLMMNLGFCRTPVGEGALVHHGSDATNTKGLYNISHGGLKSIGKAVTKGTKQFAKAATAIAESPDKRGQGKLFLAQNPQFSPFRSHSKAKKTPSDIHVEAGSPLGTDTGFGSADAKIHGIEHESFDPADVDDETVVVDSVGQRLTLKIDNVRGGGGQRRISLFCPLWIVNTTEHALIYKQEKGSSFVSGTVVSPTKDGSRPVDDSDRNYIAESKLKGDASRGPVHENHPASQHARRRNGIFAGTPGALASSPGDCPRSPEHILSLLDKDLPLQTLTEVAFMFNFQLDMLTVFKLCVQLCDGTGKSRYSSAWSHGFSLDSVGVNQIVSMPCKDGRALEVSMTLSVAPGLLSGYTKIVRFTPRFVLVNYLERPVRIWQDSSLLHPLYEGMDRPAASSGQKRSTWHWKDGSDPNDSVNQYEYLFGRSAALDESRVEGISTGTTASKSAMYICTAGTSDIVPFHLPDTRGERQLRIDLGGSWNLSSSFSADATGENTLKISRAVDSRLLCHVTTRASPQYRVVLPPLVEDDVEPWDGELGVWFETDWGGDHRIIVQGIKRESYAFNHTDIRVGDELLRVDDFSVSQMTFSEAMKLLKEKLAFMSVDRKSGKPRLRASAIILRRSKRYNVDDDARGSSNPSPTKVVLTFRTLEERLRRVRIKALKARRVNATRQDNLAHLDEVPTGDTAESETLGSGGEAPVIQAQRSSSAAVKVDMRMLHNSAFVVVRQPDLGCPPFRIENRAMDHVVFFRQRSCSSYPWNQVLPGETLAYTWEEPLRPRKLIVRVGPSSAVHPIGHRHAHDDEACSNEGEGVGDRLCERDKDQTETMKKVRSRRLKQLLSAQYVKNEEEGGLGVSVSVKLEVIGFSDILPCPKVNKTSSPTSDNEDYLNCYVDTDGVTRVLIITDKKENEDETTEIKNHIEALRQQIEQEEARESRLRELRRWVGGGGEDGRPARSLIEIESCEESQQEENSASHGATAAKSPTAAISTAVNDELQNLAEFPEDISITRCHQVCVEVIEAAGLRSSDASGMCSPYCEVYLKESWKSRNAFRSRGKEKRKTYYIENTTSPKWVRQVFIFDISPEAVHATRGYSVRVRLRNFHWIGKHPSLGQTSVYLSSLRQQQEVIGWYPLVGTKERSDVDDSLGSYGRGSVKLRLQWIHSIPGLLDYFLLLSEMRLTNLRVSADGMTEQLAHAIETEKTREQYVNSLGSFPVPEALSGAVRRKGKISDGHIRRESREDYEDLPVGLPKTKRLPRRSNVFKLRENLRLSRNMHLLHLDSQTSESKKRRRSLGRTKLSGGASEMKSTADATMALNTSITGSPESIAGRDALPGSLAQRESSTGSDASDGFESFHSSSTLGQDDIEISRRGRSFSVPEARLSSRSKVFFRDDIGMINSDVQNFSRLVHGHSFGDTRGEGQGSVVFNVEDDVWQNQHDDTMDTLIQRGFIHRKEDAGSLYRDHLAYHVRPLFMEPSSGSIYRSSVENFRGKSALRVSPVIREFRSWTTAQAVFNDYELEVDVVGTTFLIKLKDSLTASHDNVRAASCEMVSFQTSESECHKISAVQPRLPQCMPAAMRERAMRHAGELANSRQQFERACKRSLTAVLNPGGWLTIRPMTALYLPDTCTGMFVKLRYGPEVVVSETVDAKVSPTWTADTTVQVTPYAHTVSSSASKDNVFEYESSDLQVYIEPQRTSGSLRLSVIGEKLNKSKVELGVLQIPLGAAINCCVECMEEIYEEQGGKQKILADCGVPAYVRWFPLMNPKDVVAVDGDLGMSSRPLETEQERDNMFIQYFAPCIKLAFIWQPNEEKNDQGDNVRNKMQPAVVVDALQSPVAEIYCNADIGRLSLALIDSQRAVELISFYITDVDVRYSVSKAQTTTGLFLGCIQIDYQGDIAREPVVLAPTPGDNSQPNFQFVAVKDNLRSKSNITSYEYVWFTLQEMDLTIEESWVFELWEFFMSIIRRLDIRNMSTFGTNVLSTDADRAMEWAALARTTPRGSLVEEHTAEPTLAVLLEENELASGGEKKMYIGQLIMGFMKINLSYLKGKRNWDNERGGLNLRDPDGGINMQGITIGAGGLLVGRHGGDHLSPTYEKWSERTQDEDLWTDAEIKYSNLPKTIATVFPSVSDAPVRLQGKKIEHVFENPDEIFNSIKGYYQTEILSQIYKIIGALDFVGNPSMVFSSFLTGVRDFFVTPSQAFLRSPHDPSRVGMGVAKGTLSLFSHSASGVFGFISKMSASAGQVVAVLSLDDEFKQWHSDVVVAEAKGLNRQWKRRGVQSVPTMVIRPCYDVIRGVALGLTGVVVNPYVGAKRRGGAGFAKGVAAGTVGIIAKPVTGVLDAFSHASGSVYAMAKSVNVLEKRYQPPKKLRLSYAFGTKAVLMPYDQVTARSVSLLETHPMKVSSNRAEFIRAMGNEIHVASELLPMEPGVDTYLVASSHRIVLFQVKKESNGDTATSMRWQVDLTRASSVSCKLQDQGHNGLALIVSTTVPKRRAKIGRQLSPERKRGAANLDGPATEEAQGLPQLSLHDTASMHSAFLDRYEDDDEQEASELLGNKQEFEQEDNFHGSIKSKDGETLEWYTIVAEYQHSRQLNRIHNAICCIIGDFDDVLAYRSASYQGSTEGYTSFGELFFGKRPLGDALVTTPRHDKAVCEDLNVLPWMYGSMFQTLKGKSLEKQQKLLIDMRDSWLLSREVSAALKDGTPVDTVNVRAKSTFVPHAPPPLPSNVEAGDDVVSEILDELNQGNISYDQACGLISSHAKSMAVSSSPESSVSSVTEGHDLAHDQLFSLGADIDRSGTEIFRSAKQSISNQDDVFHSARQTYTGGRTPSEIKVINDSEGTPSADVQVSRSSLPFLDAMNSSDLRSLATKSLELQSATEESHKTAPLPDADSLADMGASTYSLPLDASRGARESMFPSWAHGQALRSRTESAPAGFDIPKTPMKTSSPPQVPPTADSLAPSMYDSWISQPDHVPNQSRLSRMETMLEQLIIMNARQLGHQDGYRIDGRKEEPEMIALRQEIADLRAQVQEATTDGSRSEMIAALRHEVKLLKEELKVEQRKGGDNEAFEVSDREEGVKAPGVTFEEQLNKVRPAAEKFARGIEKRGNSMAKRLRKGTFSSYDISPSIPEEDDEDKTERDVSSV